MKAAAVLTADVGRRDGNSAVGNTNAAIIAGDFKHPGIKHQIDALPADMCLQCQGDLLVDLCEHTGYRLDQCYIATKRGENRRHLHLGRPGSNHFKAPVQVRDAEDLLARQHARQVSPGNCQAFRDRADGDDCVRGGHRVRRAVVWNDSRLPWSLKADGAELHGEARIVPCLLQGAGRAAAQDLGLPCHDRGPVNADLSRGNLETELAGAPYRHQALRAFVVDLRRNAPLEQAYSSESGTLLRPEHVTPCAG
nr:hypothetical protein [Acidiphilium sp. C61]